MLSKAFLVLLLSLIFGAAISAQTADKRVDDIRSLYTSTNSAIETAEKEAPYSEIYVVELTVNRTRKTGKDKLRDETRGVDQ